ncbi:hypothetical protein M885DRAFT_621132 [Pelagophyceae sp. CCMP2097]|nr:hypothetical protein M885DRAFT_621132 [Pelagophyceae sp. CCMP2097]
MPFSVSVRERCMYSHTLRFGSGAPFRTGCTAVVDAIFTGDALGADGILIDITAAQRVPVIVLKRVLERYDHQDLDALTEFARVNTTVEQVAFSVFEQMVASFLEREVASAADAGIGGHITKLEIKVAESDVASASYYESDDRGILQGKAADGWKPSRR